MDALNEDDIIIIRSHGVKESVIKNLENRNLKIIDLTCPYVKSIHSKVKDHYEKGYKIMIIGDKTHPEVIGITGWCNDETIVVNRAEELDKIPSKICVVAQTTEKKKTWNSIMEKVVKNSKQIVAFNTICSATDIRQKSAFEISMNCDAVIVVGGKNSSNTTKLYEICKANCENSFHIENAQELTDNILKFKGKKIGITAGASTPQWILDEVIKKLKL